jgi:hypothetical protein
VHASHLVQFYSEQERVLADNVGRYLEDGLKHGDGVLVIGTDHHNQSFIDHIVQSGIDVGEPLRSGRLVFLDAAETLARFMVDGQPDWTRFEDAVRPAMWNVREAAANMRLRAYGEMVGLLWQTRQFTAAIRLEAFWNKLLRSSFFRLFCAYRIDIFSGDFHADAIDALLCAHTHFVPADSNGALESAMNRAMDSVLGERAAGLRALMKDHYMPSWVAIPRAESAILWLRRYLPHYAGEILDRARQHYDGANAEWPSRSSAAG